MKYISYIYKTNITNNVKNIDFSILLCYIKNVQKLINFTGVPTDVGVKRESGANPERTRRCNNGVLSCVLYARLWGYTREDKDSVMMFKSEDLPIKRM